MGRPRRRHARHARHRTLAALSLAALSLAALALAACGGAGSPANETRRTDPAEPTSAAADTAPSAGCGRAPDVPVMTEQVDGDATATFGADGVDRTYRLAVPADYDPDEAVPLVVNLHGAANTALTITRYTGMARAATARGMIVVAPDAIDTLWDVEPQGDDGRFIEALIEDVKARYCIDEDRVHAAGMSLGALRAALSACAYPSTFASLALVTIEVFPGDCEPVPVVAFHGTADETIPYGDGGGTVELQEAGAPGTLDHMAGWAGNWGCDAAEPAVTTIGEDVTLRQHRACLPGVDVELYTVAGGGHSWPTPAVDLAPDTPTTDTVDATQLALDFFESHPRR